MKKEEAQGQDSRYNIKYPMGTGELPNIVTDNIKTVASTIRDISQKEKSKITISNITK